jgi:two-component system, NtrC family, response regulator GlrR
MSTSLQSSSFLDPSIRPLDAAAAETLPVKHYALTVVSGPDAGLELRSSGRRLVIGSHPSADLRLTDGTVSSFHCEIAVDQRAAVIRDLGSRNGTRIDGVTVEQAILDRSALLTAGNVAIRFQLLPATSAVRLSRARRFGQLAGATPTMRAVFAELEDAAAGRGDVLLCGEVGTGKRTAARALHEASGRLGPIVEVDCGTPPAALEAALFGRGDREGAVRVARGGTLLLAHVEELPIDLQDRLTNELESAGTRVVATARRDLRSDVNARRFRADLCERFGSRIDMPALRDRLDDLPLLAAWIAARSFPNGERAVEPELVARLAHRTWPGNVAELETYLRGAIAADGDAADAAADADADADADAEAFDFSQPLKEARERWNRIFERRYLDEVLSRNRHNVSASAREAEVDRVYFYRLLRRHDIKRPA